jgi:sodium transport system permease protein
MFWLNIKLIFFRELKDQLRDRRTLFTVAIMPMLLYPLMGMALLQVGQFMRQPTMKIWVINAENLVTEPEFLVDGQIHSALVEGKEKTPLVFVCSQEGDAQFSAIIKYYQESGGDQAAETAAKKNIEQELRRRNVDVALVLTGKLPELSRSHTPFPLVPEESLGSPDVPSELPSSAEAPVKAVLFLNSASERSLSAARSVSSLLENWKARRMQQLLERSHLSACSKNDVAIQQADVADGQVAKAALWAKILPFIVVIWALTGAFYPAIDLCAGEKERGTFETLLSCPAARSEIALGKLLTVASFSYITSLLNLVSMSITGIFVASKLGNVAGGFGAAIGFPPLSSFFWLVIALLPISAFFSAIALAAAAFARSSKEGQYYLMPLIMVSMPLIILPTLPSARLDLGTSLIPISGLIMLLRGLIEGQYAAILPYVGPVCMVTITCCWLAIKWVIAQFNSESVLFRPSEQFSLQIWLKSLMRERENMPTLGHAILCAVAILVCKFFIGLAAFVPQGFGDFAVQVLVTLIAAVAAPAVIMALILSRNSRQALRLNGCSLPVACAAILAAILLHPLFTLLSWLAVQIYPPTEGLLAIEGMAAKIFDTSPGIWATILIFAVAPAIFEELGFRGFILSGMESLKTKWQPILLSSFLFGITHSVIHQSIVTFFVGIVLGIIAVQTKSLVPCVLFHAVHNAMAILVGQLSVESVAQSTFLSQIFSLENGVSLYYNWTATCSMGISGLLMMIWFWQLPRERQVEVKFSNPAVGAIPVRG